MKEFYGIKEIIKYNSKYFMEIGMEVSKSMGLLTLQQVMGYIEDHEEYYVALFHKMSN